MSNVIKAMGARPEERVTIDSNPKANMFLSGLLKTQELEHTNAKAKGTAVPEALPSAVEEAIKEQAALILGQAREEEKHIKEQALKEAKIQKRAIFDEAKEEGYKAGYENGMAIAQELEEKFKEQMYINQQEYEAKVADLSTCFSDLVIQYVERLTGYIMEEHRPIIAYLMKEAVLGAEPCKNYIIHVSAEDALQAQEAESELRELISARANLEIVTDNSLHFGECKLETEHCVFDVSLDTRLSVLEESLRLLVEGH